MYPGIKHEGYSQREVSWAVLYGNLDWSGEDDPFNSFQNTFFVSTLFLI